MRVLEMCTNFRPGGIQRHVLDLVAALRSNGHAVYLAGTPGAWMDGGRDQSFLALDLNRVADIGEGGLWQRLRYALSAARILRRFVRANAIELVHAHESAPLIVARLAVLGMGIPVLVTYHGSSPDRLNSFATVSRYAARYVITPSRRCAADLARQGGVPEGRIKVLGLGITAPPLIPRPRIEELRQSLLGDEGRLLVVTIARLTHQKGIDVLIEVVKKVVAKRRDVHFVLVGEGVLEDRVRGWIAESEVSQWLHSEGATSEPYLYLGAADLFLLTSRWEALPITIAEAFQAALPVVATDTGGVGELVSSDVGRVNLVEDADGLAASVLEICGDDGLRQAMAENARRLSRSERFSPECVHARFERFYAQILGRPEGERGP